MPDATVNIGGDASGALAAIGEVKAAIAGLTGKTVNVDVNVRQNGGGGGMSGAARDMEKLGTAAERAQQHMDRLNGSTNKVHNSVGKLGTKAGAASDHVGRLGDSSRDTAGHVETLGHSSAGTHDSVSQLGTHAKSASGSVGGLGTRANTASGHIDKLGVSATNAHDPLQRLGGLLGSGGSGGGGGSGVGGALGGLAGAGMSSIGALKGVGLAAGISAVGMGALSAAVAGVGLAGVAEDFAHNNQLMHAGQQALQGFNKEFSKMKGETTAAGSGPMAGVASSMKGVGHELAAIGAANIGPVMNDVSSLGNQATAAMHKLAPSIGPATQGLTALAGAVIGAFGDSGPAVESFANNITSHAPQIQAGLSSVVNVAAGLGNMAVDAVAAFGTVDTAMQNMLNPDGGKSGKSGAQQHREALDRALPGLDEFNGGPGGAIAKNAPQRVAGTAGGHQYSNSPMAEAWHQLFGDTSKDAQSPARSSIKPVASGAFDPSKAFSGQLPDGQGGFTTGPGDASAPKPKGSAARPSYGNFGGGQPEKVPPGPSAASIYAGQYQAATGVQPGQPMYNGLGPRGPGESGGPMSRPASFTSAMSGAGMGPIAPLNAMQSALSQTAAGGGAQTGQSMVQHIQKAVSVASPAATAGGASLGAAMNAGTAQGTTSTQSVVDTVMIKHSKHIIDVVAGGLGIHSPSDEFDFLGRMTWAGFGRGSDREAPRAFGALSGHVAGGLTAAQKQVKSGYDYQDGGPASISYNPYRMAKSDVDPAQAAADRKASFGDQQVGYKPGSEGWWSAHDNRAGQLASRREQQQRWAIGGDVSHDERRDQILQNRAGNHERALANLHISGHPKTSGDVNPFAAEQSRAAANQRAFNPFSQLPNLFNKAGQNSALGLSQGMTAHVSKVQAAGGMLAGAGHSGYKKKDKQASPSAAWGEMAGNSVAGAVGGMNAGGSALAAAGAGAAAAMAGPLNNQGLQIGYSFATNVVDGATRVLKTANFQASGTPEIANQQAKAAVGRLGLLGPGAGAAVNKTPSVGFGGDGIAAQVAAGVQTALQSLGGQSSAPRPIHIYLDKQLMQTMFADRDDDLVEQLRGALFGTNG